MLDYIIRPGRESGFEMSHPGLTPAGEQSFTFYTHPFNSNLLDQYSYQCLLF